MNKENMNNYLHSITSENFSDRLPALIELIKENTPEFIDLVKNWELNFTYKHGISCYICNWCDFHKYLRWLESESPEKIDEIKTLKKIEDELEKYKDEIFPKLGFKLSWNGLGYLINEINRLFRR